MIIDCAVYCKGVRVETSPSTTDLRAAVDALTEPDDFIWIGLHEPDELELNDIAAALDLHALAVEDVVEPHQRPKVERYGSDLFLVLKTLWYGDEGDAVETGEVNAFLGSHYFVTVRHGRGQSLTDVRHNIEDRQEVLGHGPTAALYAVVDSVVDQYERVAAELQVDIEEIEESVFATTRASDSQRIYWLKRETLEFRRAVLPLREPLERFVRGEVPNLPDAARPFFRDVVDHLARVADNIDAIDHLLDNALNAHLARLSLQQNDDMRKISAWVAMAAVPTVLTGFYGMNFSNLPWLRTPYGYPTVLVLMVALCGFLFALFKKAKWL